MKSAFIFLTILFVFVPMVHSAEAAGNEMCIVTTDERVEPGLSVEYEGVAYGVCCRGCIREFNKDPALYVDAWKTDHLANTESDDRHATPPKASTDEPTHRTTDDDVQDAHEHHGITEQHDPEADAHDHSAHGNGTDWIAWIGRFHVVLIHFPIALLVFAAGLAWLNDLRPSAAILTTALASTHAGSAGAIAATALGWATWTAATYPGAEATLLIHQITGTAVAIAAVTASWLAGLKLESPAHPRAWLITISLAAFLVSVAGHFGGSLIYGSDYFLP